jgi:hypothetical protein
VKAPILLLAVLVLFGCASTDSGPRNFAFSGPAKSGTREALQQQHDLSDCGTKSHREATKLADADGASATAFVEVEGSARYAQLDDPTKDWTREQATGPAGQCPTGRKHRYFA